MIRRWLLAAVLCFVAVAGFADQSMRSDQFPGRPWSWSAQQSTTQTNLNSCCVSGTTITPPAASGGDWLLSPVPGTGYQIACPSGTLNEGFYPVFKIVHAANDNLTFSRSCYGWGNSTPPAWSTVASGQFDQVNCSSNVPAINGVSLTCLVVPAIGPAKSLVQVKVGAVCGTSQTTCTVVFTNPIAVGDMVACGWVYQSTTNVLTSVSDGTNGFTLQDNLPNAGSAITGNTNFLLNEVSSGKTTITATLSAGKSGIQGICSEYLPTPLRALDNRAIASQSSPSGANSVTSGTATLLAGDLVWGWTVNLSGSVAPAAGTGFTLDLTDPTSGNYNSSVETLSSSSAGAVAATFTPPTNTTSWITGMIAFK